MNFLVFNILWLVVKSFCTVRKVISYFFGFLITILVKRYLFTGWKCFQRAHSILDLSGLLVANQSAAFTWLTVGLLLFSFFIQLHCNFPIKDTQVQKRTIPPAPFSLTQLAFGIWSARLIHILFHSVYLLCSFSDLHCHAQPTHFWSLAQHSRTRGVHSCGASPRFCVSSFSISLLFHSSVTKHILNILYSWAWLCNYGYYLL